MEQDEFTTVYQQFYRPLYVYALSLSGNRADAEDLVQSTFLKALLSYEGGGSLRYWLTRVLKNEYFNLWKKRKRLVDEGSFDLSLVREEDNILEDLIQDEEKRFLMGAIMKLPVHYKEVLLLIINPVLKRCCLDPRPLFSTSGSGDVAWYENEFTRYMRTYYETAQPYLTVDTAELKDRGFGRYTVSMSVLDTSRPITIGLPPNVTMNIDWGKIKTSDPQRLTGITLSRFGDGLMSEEDKADLRQEMEALPDSSILYLSLALRKARPVSEVISAPVDVNWVEVYNEVGKIQGGLTIRKRIMGEEERERAGMTDEELKQEYLSNLQHLLAQPQLLNALGQRMMGKGGHFYSYPTAVKATEPVAELFAQMEAQDVLTTKNYCISGKKQEILDYLDTIDYVSVRVDQVRLSILEH